MNIRLPGKLALEQAFWSAQGLKQQNNLELKKQQLHTSTVTEEFGLLQAVALGKHIVYQLLAPKYLKAAILWVSLKREECVKDVQDTCQTERKECLRRRP